MVRGSLYNLGRAAATRRAASAGFEYAMAPATPCPAPATLLKVKRGFLESAAHQTPTASSSGSLVLDAVSRSRTPGFIVLHTPTTASSASTSPHGARTAASPGSLLLRGLKRTPTTASTASLPRHGATSAPAIPSIIHGVTTTTSPASFLFKGINATNPRPAAFLLPSFGAVSFSTFTPQDKLEDDEARLIKRAAEVEAAGTAASDKAKKELFELRQEVLKLTDKMR